MPAFGKVMEEVNRPSQSFHANCCAGESRSIPFICEAVPLAAIETSTVLSGVEESCVCEFWDCEETGG